jgi:hypothetical protein
MPGRAERTELTPEEVKQAMEEGKSRGLPPGWTVKLDVSWRLEVGGVQYEYSSLGSWDYDYDDPFSHD